jgi:hypothetical protein
LLSLPAKL